MRLAGGGEVGAFAMRQRKAARLGRAASVRNDVVASKGILRLIRRDRKSTGCEGAITHKNAARVMSERRFSL
jgi:hypothetical protein